MRRSRRVSRPLIAALAVVIVLGSFFYLHNLKKTRAVEVSPRADASRPAIPSPQATAVVQIAAAHAQPASALKSNPSTQPDALVTETPGISGPGVWAHDHTAAPDREAVSSVLDVLPLPPTTQRSIASAAPAAQHLSVNPSSALADSRSKKESGDLLGARAELNDALLSGKLSSADADAVRQSIAEINQTVIFSPQKFNDDPFSASYPVQSGERLSTIAGKNGVTWECLSRVNGIEPRRLRSGTTIKIVKGPFHAVVYKGLFRMDIYLGSPGESGSMFVKSMPVGLGKDSSTPTGTWQVQPGNKIRHPKYYSPRGEGVIDADDPKNPLAGYWIGLQGLDGQAIGKNSYGIHGTIDPNSIGKMESMGCIRMRAEDIALVFDLLVEGKSKVVVKD